MTQFHPINPTQVIRRIVDNLEPIGIQCLAANGDPEDLRGKTMLFRMIAADGTVVVDDQAASLVEAGGSGKVSYSPAAEDVATAGRYALYVIDDDDTVDRRWPATPTLILELLNEAPQ